jgi:hypothetical protein
MEEGNPWKVKRPSLRQCRKGVGQLGENPSHGVQSGVPYGKDKTLPSSTILKDLMDKILLIDTRERPSTILFMSFIEIQSIVSTPNVS